MKKFIRESNQTTVELRINAEFELINGKPVFTIPVVPMDEYSGPVISDELRQWSVDNEIDEDVYGQAY